MREGSLLAIVLNSYPNLNPHTLTSQGSIARFLCIIQPGRSLSSQICVYVSLASEEGSQRIPSSTQAQVLHLRNLGEQGLEG